MRREVTAWSGVERRGHGSERRRFSMASHLWWGSDVRAGLGGLAGPARYAVPAGAAMLVFASWLHEAWGGPQLTKAIDDLGLLLFALAAIGAAAAAAVRHRGRERRAWAALAVGLLGWAAGEGVWSYYVLWLSVDQAPFPSPADAGFLTLPVGAGIALALLPTRLGVQSRVRLVVDGLLVAGSLFVVSWLTVLSDVVRAGGDSPASVAVSVAYPVADLVILSMVVVVGAHARAEARLPLGLLGAGMAFMAVSDSVFVYLSQTSTYASGNVADNGWALGLLTLGLAAASSIPRPARPDRRVQVAPSRVRLWFPYVPVLLATMVGLPMAEPHLTADPAAIAAVVLVVALLIRQLLALSDNHRLLHRLAHQAHHDPLTGLANRALFHDRLQCALDAEQLRGTGVTVMSIDLDDFKQINDTMGHHRGDQLLTQAAARLVGCFRSTDTVARMGGDEFTILIHETADADELIARVRAAFAEPFTLSGCPICVRPSIGIAALSIRGARMDPEQLLHLADQGMYADKTRRKNLNDQARHIPAARASTY